MKRSYLLLGVIGLIFLILSKQARAQAPQTFSYQGIARDASGIPLKNKIITIRLTIINAAVSGGNLYSETKTASTNSFGLYSVVLNDGSGQQQGNFSAIDWTSGGQYLLQTEIDPAAGNTFVNMGSVQLHSVPFALHATSADKLAGATNPQEGDHMVFRNGKWRNSKANQILTASGAGFSPNSVLNFIGTYAVVEITDSENQLVKMQFYKAVGSSAAQGAGNLTVYLGFQQLSNTQGEVYPVEQFPISGMSNLQVPKGTRLPITMAGAFKLPRNGRFRVGIVGTTPYPGEWNNNEGGGGLVEVINN